MWLYLCVYVQEREPEERSRFSTEQKKKKKKVWDGRVSAAMRKKIRKDVKYL